MKNTDSEAVPTLVAVTTANYKDAVNAAKATKFATTTEGAKVFELNGNLLFNEAR